MGVDWAGWPAAVPVALLAAGLLLVPGLLVAAAAGVRGVALPGVAPLLSVAVVALAAVGAGALGSGWGWPPVLLGTAGLAVLAVPLRRRRAAGPADPTATRWAGLAGAAAAAVLVVVGGVRGIGRPDAVSQTFDAVFHLNLIARVLQTGDASPLHAGTLNQPGSTEAFYPAAFHAFAALVAGGPSAPGVPAAANLTALAVAALAWPLSMLLLVRVVVGTGPGLVAAGAALSGGFVAMPFLLLGFGVLWPNLLALAVLPAAVAAAVELGGQAATPVLGRIPAAALLVLALPTLALAHPNAVFSLLLLAGAVAAAALLPVARRLWLAGRRRTVLLAAGTAVLAVLLADQAVRRLPMLAGVRQVDWPARETLAQALGEGLLSAPVGQPIGWAVALLVLAGLVEAGRRPRLRWLLAAHLLGVGLYAYAAGVDSPLSLAVTGYWYNDKFRLAALTPITGVPLAALGAAVVGRWVLGWAARQPRVSEAIRPRLRPLTLLAPAAVVLVVALVSGGLGVREHAGPIRQEYAGGPGRQLVSPTEQQFYAGLGRLVPPGATIVNDPWDGSALAWALSGRTVLFPHLLGHWGPDRTEVLAGFDQLGHRPAVCRALDRLRARYLLHGAGTFWPGDLRAQAYAQLSEPQRVPGLRLVAWSGQSALYEITACTGGGAQPAQALINP